MEYYSSCGIKREEFVRALSPDKDMLTRACYVSLLGNAHVAVDRYSEDWMQGVPSTIASLKKFSQLKELIVD